MEKAAKSEDEETMIKAEAYQDKMNQAAQKMAFFMQIWDDLTTAGKTYDKERLKGAVYVRRSKGWDWHKVYKLNPKTVSHTWFVGAWNSPYSEIVDAVYEGESFTVEPSHVKGSFKITKTPSLSGYSFYRKNQKTL